MVTIDTLLEAYPEGVQALVREARGMLQKWPPEAKEGVDEFARILGYRYGPGY